MRQLKHNLLNPLKKSVAAGNLWKKSAKIILLCACCTAFYGCASSGEYASRPHLPQQPISQNPHDHSFHKVLQLAQEGNPQAQYAAGYRYYYGIGVAENIRRAKAWLYRAATKGNQPARQALRDIKIWEGDHSDEDAAIVYYTPAPAYLPPPPTNRHQFASELAADGDSGNNIEEPVESISHKADDASAHTEHKAF